MRRELIIDDQSPVDMPACRDAIKATMLDYFITEMATVIIRGFISQAILQIEGDMTMREVPFGSYDWRKK